MAYQQELTIQIRAGRAAQQFMNISRAVQMPAGPAALEMSGYAAALQELADLYRSFAQAYAGYHRMLSRDMQEAVEAVTELEEADEGIFDQTGRSSAYPAADLIRM